MPKHDLAIHLDKAAVGIIGETRIAAVLGKALDRPVVEAEVEHGIHHARHGSAGTGAYRYQQWLRFIAELGADAGLNHGKRSGYLLGEFLRIGFIVGVEKGADLGRDREARRHRQAEMAHFGQVGAFTSEKIFHLRPAFRRAAEAVNPLRHGPLPFDLGEISDPIENIPDARQQMQTICTDYPIIDIYRDLGKEFINWPP